MKLRYLFIINSIIAGVFGVVSVLLPGKVISLYGSTPEGHLIYKNQLFGAALITFAILTWLARNAGESEARKAIILALFIGESLGFVVALIGQLQGAVNTFGWTNVAIYLFFALGFGYFLIKKPAAPKA